MAKRKKKNNKISKERILFNDYYWGTLFDLLQKVDVECKKLNINYSDCHINAEYFNDYGDDSAKLKIYAYTEETDEEYEERMKSIEEQKKKQEERDREQYLELKRKFGE